MSRALSLLTLAGILAMPGCSNNPNSDEMSGAHSMDDAMASAKRVSGDGATVISACEAIGFDSDADGIDDTFAFVLGKDWDGDTFAVVPTNSSDVTADGEYGCGFDLLDGFVVIDELADIGTDCNDSDAAINPDGTEIADDGIDQDCSGEDLESDPDADLDGYHASVDCNDADAAINPGAVEMCDGMDNNCDGLIDDPTSFDAVEWYPDADLDTYGAASGSAYGCYVPEGYVSDATDCDDGDAAINPGAIEVCDDIDNNCDGAVDTDTDPMLLNVFYVDGDGDTYGDPGNSALDCDAPSGYVVDGTDCDDGNINVNPGMSEVLDNGIDDNCDGVSESTPVDNDVDGDGYDSEASGGTDCDDGNINVNPGMSEVLDNGIDDNCDGISESTPVDNDVDGDGYDSEASGGTDCNDGNAAVNPGATDVDNDDLDSDCDGEAVGKVCFESDSTYAYKLMFSDTTTYTWYGADVNWEGGLAFGVGLVCAEDVLIVAGHSAKVQCGYDMDLDGNYGEDPGDYWCYMNSSTNVGDITIMGMSVFSMVVSTSWGVGSDGILATIPELPTE